MGPHSYSVPMSTNAYNKLVALRLDQIAAENRKFGKVIWLYRTEMHFWLTHMREI